MSTDWNAVIIRYDEIGLKGNNRLQFEKKLIDNIRLLIKPSGIPVRIQRVRGRMWLSLPYDLHFTEAQWETIRTTLPRAFGVSSFSPVVMCAPKWEEIQPLAAAMTLKCLKRAMAEEPGNFTFRMRARRADKRFPYEARECEKMLIDGLPQDELDLTRMKLDLNDAKYTVGLEIRENFAFVWFDTYLGNGGLPVGSNEAVLTLLSGGIDSPVAAWLLMKRGCRSDFVTFDSAPYTPPESVDKVKTLVRELNRWQGIGRLWICNIVEIQKAIRDNCKPRFRTVLYRRMMMRISTKIAERDTLHALVTGEAVGQVASQTITNMNTINAAAGLVVIRPLAGTDKRDTVDLAKKIGTFETSKLQVPDSCTVFAPDSPTTRASIRDIEYEEKRLGDIDALVNAVIEAAEIYNPLFDDSDHDHESHHEPENT